MKMCCKSLCTCLAGTTILLCGCIIDGEQKSEESVSGALVCSLIGVRQRSCKYSEFFEKWDVKLVIRIKIQNETNAVLSLRRFNFEAWFSETEIYVLDRTGRVRRFTTLGLGRVGLLPDVYAIRDLEPNGCCDLEVECTVLAFDQDDPPGADLEWLFPSQEGWFHGERVIGEESAGPCEFRINVKGSSEIDLLNLRSGEDFRRNNS